MKRIVKEILENGKVQYRVEEKSIYSMFTKWYTCKAYDSVNDIWYDTVFKTLKEAKIEAGIEDKVINREILMYN